MQSSGIGCPPAPDYSGFRDAFDFILHERESISGGVCIGGPGELIDLGGSHLLVSLVAVAIAVAVAVPIGLWLGHRGRGEFLAVSVSNVGRAVPSLALPTIFGGIRISAVNVVATATIAPLANVKSLGNPILEPQTYGDAGQLGAAIVVALITLAVDLGLAGVQRLVTPAGLKRTSPSRSARKRFSTPVLRRT